MSFSRRPDISDEEIGIRTFQIRKEKAEERAMEKIRAGLKEDWSKLTRDQIEKLAWVLGEVWAHVGRAQWDHIPFNAVTRTRIEEIVSIAQQIMDHTKVGSEGLEEVLNVLEKA
ncbi:MAG: hypothetical protein ACE5E0_03910 [Terriglobia bacterium]